MGVERPGLEEPIKSKIKGDILGRKRLPHRRKCLYARGNGAAGQGGKESALCTEL